MPDTPQQNDEVGSLERARRRLYAPADPTSDNHATLLAPGEHTLPHAWDTPVVKVARSHKHVRLAGFFFGAAFLFFLVAVAASAYLLYFGGNDVSVNNIDVVVQGPNSISGGDTVPLALAITNHNSVALDNATIEIDFPAGTRSASDVTQDYPRYVENLGTIAPGATVARSVSAVLFGGEGQSITIPISLSYGTDGSNAVFVKKTSYALAVASTPLSISVEAPAEAVSGQALTLNLTVRSNATGPLNNVVVADTLPFGFTLSSSSPALSGGAFLLGTIAPGASEELSLTGTLTGDNSSTHAFQFSVGTASSGGSTVIAVPYMQQSASVALTAPFISTSLAINGENSAEAVIAPSATQTVTLSYTNTLTTDVTNTSIQVQLSGGAVDYTSVQTSNGFYQSATHSIIFSRDNDPALATLAPGASGVGTFTFSTLPASTSSHDPVVTFTTSVSGTRVGQSNVPESVSASSVTTAKVSSAIALTETTLHSSGPFKNSGPIPPVAGSPTTYTIEWQIVGGGNAVAGASVTATLPSYVSYTGATSGAGGITYDSGSRTVTWNAGDVPAEASVTGAFQVSLNPSSTQRGTSPFLTGPAALTGFDRYAQTSVAAQAAPSDTETPSDPGYSANNADVQ